MNGRVLGDFSQPRDYTAVPRATILTDNLRRHILVRSSTGGKDFVFVRVQPDVLKVDPIRLDCALKSSNFTIPNSMAHRPRALEQQDRNSG